MFNRHRSESPYWTQVKAHARQHASHVWQSRHLRRRLLLAAVVLFAFGLLRFLAVPPLLRSQLQSRMSALLDRPVTIGAVHFNPYTLRFDLDRLHIGGRDGRSPFVDVDRLTVNVSWSSLFRRAPVLDELSLQHPRLHITRSAPQQFNFSDLVGRLAGQPDPNAAPARFALANIRVHQGVITYDDQVLHGSHRIDQLEIGIPFLANLPADTDLFVQPLLAARVDGSAMRIEGRTKPFASSRESVIDFQLDHLDLPRYLGYVPLPVTIPRGQLSGKLALHFSTDAGGNQLRLSGQLTLDDFALADRKGGALLELGHGTAALTDAQPLRSRYRLGAVVLDRPALHYSRSADGHANFDALTAADPSRPSGPPTELTIDALTWSGGRFDYADLGTGGDRPGTLGLRDLAGSLRGFSSMPAPAARLAIAGQLAGGHIASQGRLDLANARYRGRLQLTGAKLAPLQPLALPQLQATIDHGTLDVDGQLQADWGRAANVHLQPATIAIDDLALSRDDATTPVRWQALLLKIGQLDLATRVARIDSLTARGMQLDVRRQRDGSIDLAALMTPTATATKPSRNAPQPAAAAASPPWRWSVAQLRLDDSDIGFKDLTADKPMPLAIHVEHYRIEGLSDDLLRPVQLTLTGRLGKGGYDVSGSVKPQPLDADLRLRTRGMDIAPLQSLISVPLNVRVGSALLSLDGRLQYRDHGSAPAYIDYRGQATLGRVRVQDKLSGDDFLRWHSLAATGIAVRLGQGAPQADIGGLALSDFYARVIVNPSGRINLQDVVASPQTAPISVTREQSAPQAAAAASAAKAAQPEGPRPRIRIGQITVMRGQLNYTDNFIKPNYSANITDLAGKVGAFGTAEGTQPAELVLQGKLDENSPVDIGGTINPLTPVAFLDIKAKADGVELTHLSPYSGKYAGYPITGGRLNVDVHYQLDQRKLTADNHIFINQLQFGNRIDGPGISHLPVKLAVALLKDTDGNIDVHVPVSGSLDDPQFSMGGLVWHAIVNLLTRAVTSPFRLLASLGGGSHADLGYVEFAPGSAVLDAEAHSRLGQLVKLLENKPSLTLDVTGRIDPSVDEKGLRKVMVDDLVHQAKVDDDGKHEDPATLQLTPDEYQHYLIRVYRHAKFPKPKNLLGLTKSQPPEEMHLLLETNMPVDAAAMKNLAERRGQAVQAWLKGKLEDKRVAMQPPRLDAKGIRDKGSTTRVDFGLH